MTWEEKLEKLMELTPACLVMREPGGWFVRSSGRHILKGTFLTSSYGNGKTPQEAVEDDWRRVAESGETIAIQIPTGSTGYRRVRWDGTKWEAVGGQS